MNKRMISLAVALTLGLGVVASSAWAQSRGDNDRYGETRWNNLPRSAAASKNVWVGSWWPYIFDGISHRWDSPKQGSDAVWSASSYQDKVAEWTKENTDQIDAKFLSPAEKFDRLMGRTEKVEYDLIKDFLEKHYAVAKDLDDKIEERRKLTYTLNTWIEANPGKDWKETDDGKRYLEITKEIDESKKDNEHKFNVDSATEFEILEHGTGQFGNENWFGHCNAWAGAAIMDAEPIQETTVDGIVFTPGDVKALLTEAWMELRSSFYGTRSDYNESYGGDSKAREAVSYQDVTPAAFHIFFADELGNKDRSFVIDRYTGGQVWNQPVKAFRATKVTKLYEETTDDAGNTSAKPVEVDLKFTRYGYNGDGEIEDLGKREVYPIEVTATIHWVTDGLPHDAVTVPYRADIDDDTFTNSWNVRQLFDDQIEMRTLTYTLWLDKPMEDPEARIIGDGEWNHGQVANYNHLHPDFMWQPQANTPASSYRRYENPYVDYKVIADRILPGMIKPEENPETPPSGTYAAADVPVDIPDASADGARSVVSIGDDISISEMTVTVKIEHTYRGDLRVRLLGPDGRKRIIKRFGSGGSKDNYERTLDVKNWKGKSSKGDWTLEVIDQWAQDTGKITVFEIQIK